MTERGRSAPFAVCRELLKIGYVIQPRYGFPRFLVRTNSTLVPRMLPVRPVKVDQIAI
jgi:ABC-type proline/glycine betaine transport system ATPase subunit